MLQLLLDIIMQISFIYSSMMQDYYMAWYCHWLYTMIKPLITYFDTKIFKTLWYHSLWDSLVLLSIICHNNSMCFKYHYSTLWYYYTTLCYILKKTFCFLINNTRVCQISCYYYSFLSSGTTAYWYHRVLHIIVLTSVHTIQTLSAIYYENRVSYRF